MKMLDEVISTLDGCFLKNRKEWCIENCPYLQNDEQMCRRNVLSDALYYLEEYHEHLKWQAYEEHCLAEEKKKIKQAYEQGYAQAKQDDAVARSWEESYRQSQMPWNHYTEMGG